MSVKVKVPKRSPSTSPSRFSTPFPSTLAFTSMNDLRHAVRSLLKTPGFSVIALLVVALGIAVATAMFSVVNTLVLRPVAVPEPERLVAVYETNLARNVPWFSCSYVNYVDWRDRSQSWESLAAVGGTALNLTGGGEPEFIWGVTMTANFLSTLGHVPTLGRGFLAEEDRPGFNQVAIISHGFWQRRFGGRSDVVGQTLTLNGTAHTIVGVMAAGAFFPGDFEVGIPMGVDLTREDRSHHDVSVYGRLKPGVTLEHADAELKAIAAQIEAANPDIERGWRTQLVPLIKDLFASELRTGLLILLGAVGVLLLIACANLSNLLLVRTSARAHELAIRTALGASRGQVVRQIVTESVLVTAAGGLLGVLISLWAVDLMHALPLPRAGDISVDWCVLLAALAATLLTGFFSGLGPALNAAQARPQEALKGRAPRSGHRSRLRDTMVVTQLALSLTLLIGAALLGRSFLRLLQVDPGFNTENTLTVSLRPADSDRAAQFYTRLTDRIAALPGVTQAGAISALPLTEGNTSLNVFPEGTSIVPAGESIQSSWRLVDSGYFEAMQIPLVRGRTFAGLTPDEARRSVVISTSLARALWGDSDPVGRQLDPGGNRRFLTVIGVVGEVRSQKLGSAAAPTFYWSMHRFIYGPMHLVVRSSGDPAPLLPAIRAAVKEIDPTVPVIRVRTLDQLRATNLDHERLLVSLLGGFTAIALFLAALGTYGVIAYTVQQRLPEIGIRIAIGAQTGDILRLIIGQGLRLVLFGAVFGVAGALAATRLLSSMLYETGATDPSSYLAATSVLVLTALLACLLPARRATKVDPVVALRAE